MSGEFIKLVGFSPALLLPSASLSSRLPLCAISFVLHSVDILAASVLDFPCSFCQMTFLFLQVTHTKPQRICSVCVCEFPLPLLTPFALSSATNVAYIFWLTLYQDGRRLGTRPKAMHKPIKCYLESGEGERGRWRVEEGGGVAPWVLLLLQLLLLPGQWSKVKWDPLESCPNCSKPKWVGKLWLSRSYALKTGGAWGVASSHKNICYADRNSVYTERNK